MCVFFSRIFPPAAFIYVHAHLISFPPSLFLTSAHTDLELCCSRQLDFGASSANLGCWALSNRLVSHAKR